MSAPTPEGAVTTRLVRLGRSDEYASQPAVLAGVVVLTPALFLLCARGAGSGVPLWLVVLCPLMLLLVPHTGSVVPLLVWAGLGVVWVGSVPGPFSWWALPAAVCALLAHLAATGLAGTPTTLAWATSTRRRYAVRLAVVVGATALVAALADLVGRASVPGLAALTTAALLAVSAWLWAGRLRDAEPPPEADPSGAG